MIRTRFGAKRHLLINPHGPPPPWKTNSGKYTPAGYLSTWNANVGTSPPSWNPLLMQDNSTYRIGVKKPLLKSVSFGKTKKPSKALRRSAKKHGVKVTLKRGKKRLYKSERVLKKQIKSVMKTHKKGKKTVVKKPSKVLRKVAKKYKIKVTLKRGNKRVYKSERVLQKQIKSAMKMRKRKLSRQARKKITKRSNKKRHRIVKRRVGSKNYLTELKSRVARKKAMNSLRKYTGPKLKNDFGRFYF
jgi:mRNA-degrading endonuclease toxin of MazEF toxin-antitoxin module